jgi:autotransporter-associated beta strand protein
MILVIAALGASMAVAVTPTFVPVPNSSFEQDVTADGTTLSPPTSWTAEYGTSSNARVWNPTSADFSGAGGNGALPGTAQGSQCMTNVATTWNNDVDMVNGTSDATAICALVPNRVYTITVALGSPSTAKIYDGQSIGFIDINAQTPIATHDDIFPTGRDWSNMKGWGTFGDVSFTINSNNYIVPGATPGTKNVIAANDNMGVVLAMGAGVCFDNVRVSYYDLSQLYASGGGTWDNSSARWASTAGGAYNNTWTAGKDAVFQGSPGIVTVGSGGVSSVNSIAFATDGYTLTGGAITMTGTGGIATATSSGTDIVNSVIGGSVGLNKSGAGTLILGAANTFTGFTRINGGTLQLAHSNALQNSTLDYNTDGGVIGFGNLTNVTLGGLQGSQNLPLVNSVGGNVALSVGNNNVSTVYRGVLSGGGGLTKVGSGALTLYGANTYTGTTDVQSGTLQINNASATANVLTNVNATAHTGGTNVSNGYLVLDCSANTANESSLVSKVQSLLQTAYNGGANSFQAGHDYQLYTTYSGVTSGTTGLGWVDNATTHQVTIMPALYGDCNLSGKVDFSDLSILLANYGKAGTYCWSQGDFSYDGTVNFSDLSKLLANYGKTGGLAIGNIPNLTLDPQAIHLLASDGFNVSGATAVPEPSSAVLVLFAAATLLVYRRRFALGFLSLRTP